MARPSGYGYPLIPDPYPVRTQSVPVGYPVPRIGYPSALQQVPGKDASCHASMFGPCQRVPDLAYLPIEQMGKIWTQHLGPSDSNHSQTTLSRVQHFWTQHFWTQHRHGHRSPVNFENPSFRPGENVSKLPSARCRKQGGGRIFGHYPWDHRTSQKFRPWRFGGESHRG